MSKFWQGVLYYDGEWDDNDDCALADILLGSRTLAYAEGMDE
jgi:hypothetical protein